VPSIIRDPLVAGGSLATASFGAASLALVTFGSMNPTVLVAMKSD